MKREVIGRVAFFTGTVFDVTLGLLRTRVKSVNVEYHEDGTDN